MRAPQVDFPVFRAVCRDQLDPDDFALVDDRYVTTHHDTQTWHDQQNDPGAVDEDAFATWLRGLLDRCSTADQMLTTIRAVQACLFVNGWFVQVDLDAFLGANQRVLTSAARDEETWRRLRAYRQPYRQAVCAMAAAGLSIDQMRATRLSDVDVHAIHVLVDGIPITIEPPAREGLLSQVHHQRILGFEDDQPLLTDSDDNPLSDYQLRRAVKEPLLEVGVALLNGKVVVRTIDERHWARRRGVSLQHLQ